MTARRHYHPPTVTTPQGLSPDLARRLTEIAVAAVRGAVPATPARRQARVPVILARATEPVFSPDTDPRHDPHYIDNVIDRIRCSPLAADRYVLVWDGGRKLIFNDDIDWTRTSTALPLFDVQKSAAAAKTLAAENHDIAVQGRYDRVVAFYTEGGAILPTWFSPETTPNIYALLGEVRAKVRIVAGNVEELARGQRNAMIIGAIVGGVLRVFVRFIPLLRPQSEPLPEPAPKAPAVRRAPPEEPGTPPPPAKPAPRSDLTPKAPAPPPRTISNAQVPDIEALVEEEGFVYEGITADGKTAVYRHPDTGQRANVTLRQGGPKWLNPAWGRNRIVAEARQRGFILNRKSDTGGGFLYENPATGERLRIMPRPFASRKFSNDDIEKHLTDFYYRYKPGPNAPEGPHSAIVDKPVFGPDKPPATP
jgi:hypothetical protein